VTADHVRWVAARWSDWLRSHPAESWLEPSPGDGAEDLFAARAVLRVLQRLKLSEGRGFRIEHVGLRPVADYEAPIARLVNAHLGGQAHCGEDVGATAAALELARWLGALSLEERRRIEAWLRARFDGLGSSDAGFADRVEIARVLEDPQLLRRALGRAPAAIPISAAATLRAAAAASRLEPPDLAAHLARAESAHTAELADPRSAAAYLADLARLRAHWAGKRHALTASRPETLEAAVDAVVAGRFLATDLATAAPDHETVSMETLALLTYFPTDRQAMAAFGEARRGLPETLTASARAEAGVAMAQLAGEKARAEALAARARRILVVPTLIAAAAVAAGLAVLVAVLTDADWAGIASAPLGFVVGLVLVTLALDSVGLAAPWALRLARRVGAGQRATPE
jgi:hypothetical protein